MYRVAPVENLHDQGRQGLGVEGSLSHSHLEGGAHSHPNLRAVIANLLKKRGREMCFNAMREPDSFPKSLYHVSSVLLAAKMVGDLWNK